MSLSRIQLALFFLAIALLGCGGTNPPEPFGGFGHTGGTTSGTTGGTGSGPARARSVNVNVGSPGDTMENVRLDFLVANRLIAWNVDMLATSRYVEVPVGRQDLSVGFTGIPFLSFFTTQETFEAGKSHLLIGHTSYSMNFVGAYVLKNDPTLPAAGNFRIRVTNANITTDRTAAIDVLVKRTDASGGTPQFQRIGFRSASNYIELPVGTYEILTYNTRTSQVVGNSGALSIASGVYTYVAHQAGVRTPNPPRGVLVNEAG